jgi:hypothetical protein
VFNNDASDGSFGVTEPVVLDELNPYNGRVVKAVTVPDNPARGDYLTTSFSSKSELAINQSTDGRYDTFIGYVAAPGTIDASNANTPGEIDPTIADSANPVYRAVAQVNSRGQFGFTETNAFSGDNGRAAVLDPEDGPNGTIFAVGNADILKGFPTALAKNATDASDYPFGLGFANPTTLYVADEGAGDNTYDATTNTYTAAAASTTAGLQKWSFNSSAGQWQLDYVLQSGLDLGTPYRVARHHGHRYPTGLNTSDSGSGLPWAPATDGLRGLTGRVSHDGTVTLWASTSTVSGSGDQGADPNKLVQITDNLAATTASQVAHERFCTVIPATYGQVVRGVSFTPCTPLTNGNNTGPRPSLPQVSSGPLPGRERG